MGFGAIVGALASKGLDVGASAFLQHNQANLESRFYRHRHQYEVRDLRAAGLNPVLSALNGASGGLNVGLVGTGDTAQSAAALHNAMKQDDLITAQENKTKADTATSLALGKMYTEQANSARQQANLIAEQAKSTNRENVFYSQNPDVYRAMLRERAVPGLGGKASVASDVVEGVANSAKPLVKRVIKAISPRTRNEARRLFELSGEQ